MQSTPKLITIKRFDGGIALDPYEIGAGEFSVSKHFDIFTYPFRLAPLRGMTSDTASTAIGNIIVGSDNNFYGMGTSGGVGQIYTRSSGAWVAGIANLGDAVKYDLLVEYHDNTGARRLIYAGNNELGIVNLALSSNAAHALTFTNIAQGFVHPKDDILYIPYDNKIAKNDNGTWTDAALTLPANYRITSLTYYGDYLAIAVCPSVNGVDYGGSAGNVSKVFLWDRNTSNTTVSEEIDWGTGNLKVLNNLDGVLIGVSDQGGSSSNILDRDSIVIRGYVGGTPVILKELSTLKETTTTPDAAVNPRVNFIYRNRLYFSLTIQGGSTSPLYSGLWAIGKSKASGRYAVTIERVATNTNTETSVLAAAIAGDKTCMCYDAEGTLSVTNSLTGLSSPFAATSIWESGFNPDMPDADKVKPKKIYAVAVSTLPLPSGASVALKARVDGGSWANLGSMTSGTRAEITTGFTDGTHHEFRLESTLGAVITGFAYRYAETNNNL